MKNFATKILTLFIALIAINYLSDNVYKRFDLTKDKRYTLSETTKNILEKIEEPALIEIYLEGDFPSEFKRLQIETKQHLEELKAINKHIKFRFINPTSIAEKLIKRGLQPSRLSVQEGGKVSEAIIFPWATISYKNKKENISLLASQTFTSQEKQLQSSVENLEYAFSDAIHKISSEKKQKIAIIKGNGELQDIYLAGFLTKLKTYYSLAPFTLDSVLNNPQKTLQELSDFDLAIIAKPTIKFKEQEKFVLDQFITNGGKTLWLIDNVNAEQDSLMQTGQTLAFNRDLNLTDLLFSYGVRLHYDLIKDIQSTTIRLASGNSGNQTQFQDFPWHYFPKITSTNTHPITKNVDPIRLRFANTIDTLKNGIRKIILLQSSPYAKAIGTPSLITLDEVAIKPVQKDYNKGFQNLGVLLEGEFKSAYATRIKPFETKQYIEKSKPNKMIVIADGDIIANETIKGQPIDLDRDKYTASHYGNSTFLLNAINYMLDDTGLVQLRSKTIQLQFLDKKKAYTERTFWQWINVISPLVMLLLFGLLFSYLRKRKYR